MITLIQAFNLCKIRDDEIVFLRETGKNRWFALPCTGRNVREKYDMKKTKVKSISPRFGSGAYAGMEFEIVRTKQEDGK